MSTPPAARSPLPRLDAFHDRNVEAVQGRLKARSRVGLMRYGTDTRRADFDARRWLRELQDELLDAAVYIEAALNAIDDGRV